MESIKKISEDTQEQLLVEKRKLVEVIVKAKKVKAKKNSIV